MSNSISPIQLASKLQTALRDVDASVTIPPQMIYNYLKNNVRKLKTSYAHEEEIETSKGYRRSYRFSPEKAEEFITLMVEARKEQIEKKKAKLLEEDK